ncbi:hypothetical protein ACFSX5_19080 [Devosia albogilva]|uniref:Transposase IS111A/IS1328/IS1533 N-terminal domain-containing protein n=1 Tax=Devosia albogilva TaxID=429726 RepID=A0ABW5QQ95_9HYPH
MNNDAAGWQAAAEWLLKAGVDRVGIEASGGYERGVVAALREAGFKVILHQPLQVRLLPACGCSAPRTTGWMPG